MCRWSAYTASSFPVSNSQPGLLRWVLRADRLLDSAINFPAAHSGSAHDAGRFGMVDICLRAACNFPVALSLHHGWRGRNIAVVVDAGDGCERWSMGRASRRSGCGGWLIGLCFLTLRRMREGWGTLHAIHRTKQTSSTLGLWQICYGPRRSHGSPDPVETEAAACICTRCTCAVASRGASHVFRVRRLHRRPHCVYASR